VEEGIELCRLPFYFNRYTASIVTDEAGEICFDSKTVDEWAEAYALNDSAHQDAATRDMRIDALASLFAFVCRAAHLAVKDRSHTPRPPPHPKRDPLWPRYCIQCLKAMSQMLSALY